MTDQLGLFARGRRETGPHERALGETLRAWRALDHLTGPENAARRAMLRQLARAADEAHSRMSSEDASPWTASSCDREYRAALDAYAPPEAPHRDLIGESLEAEALAALAALETSP